MKKFFLNLAASAAAGFGATYTATGNVKTAAGAAAVTAIMNAIGLAQKPPTKK